MSSKLYEIQAGYFRLDGGAMFGVVPKSIWGKTNPPNAQNKIDMSMRCLLIEQNNRLILIDTGLGDKQSEKFFGYYDLYGTDSLLGNIKARGFVPEDITDVFFTHLHFDHVGGAFKWQDNNCKVLSPVFPRATYWSNKAHWNWATKPNEREKPSFLPENIQPLYDSGRLNLLEKSQDGRLFVEELGLEVLFIDGHTEAQMLPCINYKDKKILFMADLLPTMGHIKLPYIMGYDTRPLVSLEDRKKIYPWLVKEKVWCYLEHDATNQIITLTHSEKGYSCDGIYCLEDLG